MVKKKGKKSDSTKTSTKKRLTESFKKSIRSPTITSATTPIIEDRHDVNEPREDAASFESSDMNMQRRRANAAKNRRSETGRDKQSPKKKGSKSRIADDKYSFDSSSISSNGRLYDSIEEDTHGNETNEDSYTEESYANSKKKKKSSRSKKRGGKEESKATSERQVRSKHSQACKYLQKGNFDKALQCFENILEILIEKYGEQHYRVGAAMHNIGIVHLRAGDLTDALEALELAVAVRKASLGKLHPKVADSLVEMGIVFLSLKRYDDALDVLNEALDLREREVSTSTDPRKQLLVAKILNNIGCVYYEYGDMRAARKTLNEALKIQEEILGNDDPTEPGLLSMASTMCNVGYVYLERKKFDDAIVMFEEALSIQEEVLGGDNTLVIHTMDNLAYALSHDGNYDGAMKIYVDILESQREMQQQSIAEMNSGGGDRGRGDHHSHHHNDLPSTSDVINLAIDISNTLKKMAYIHLKLYQYDEALGLLTKILKIQEKYHKNIHEREIQNTQKMINGVNYHILKFHSPTEALIMSLTSQGIQNPFTNRALDFSFMGKVEDELDCRVYVIVKPKNTSKVSGHKITYA